MYIDLIDLPPSWPEPGSCRWSGLWSAAAIWLARLINIVVVIVVPITVVDAKCLVLTFSITI